MPYNIETEQALLGAILVNNDAALNVSFITPEHFYEPVHGRIYKATKTLIERGQIANPVTLKAYFDNDGALKDIGGVKYLMRMASNAASVLNAKSYGNFILEDYIGRCLVGVGEEIIDRVTHPNPDVLSTDILLQATATLDEIQPYLNGVTTSLATHSIERLEFIKKSQMGKMPSISTGLRDLDKMIGGLRPGQLIIIAGATSMGKTALAVHMAFTAGRKHKVGFFSLEMGQGDMAARFLTLESGITMPRTLMPNQLSNKEIVRIENAQNFIASLDVRIEAGGRAGIDQIKSVARGWHRKSGIELIIIDYLQLVSATNQRPSTTEQLGEITGKAKILAMELDIPVVLLSQLSRKHNERDNKRPILSDLRYSGSIEQDADIVIFAYRDEYYTSRLQNPDATRVRENKGICELIVAKQRNGETGKCKVRFNQALTKFEDL